MCGPDNHDPVRVHKFGGFADRGDASGGMRGCYVDAYRPVNIVGKRTRGKKDEEGARQEALGGVSVLFL